MRAVAGILSVLVLTSCGGTTASRLWVHERSRHHVGERWVEGVSLGSGRDVSCREGTHLRFEALNPTTGPVTLRLAAGDATWSLAVAPLDSAPVDVPCDAGSVRLGGESALILAEPRVVRPRSAARTVVFVLVDTLRADHVNPKLTPAILRAFAQGRRFLDANSNAPWTLPSVASLFTARPVLALTAADGSLIGIPDGVPTLAEAMHTAGYATGAAVANYSVHALNGYASGFDTFVVPDGHGTTTPPDASWVVAEARRWLDEHEGEDRFVYLHLMDPHEPYRDHEKGTAAPIVMRELANRLRPATPQETEALPRAYASEVAHVDRVLGPFLGDLPRDAVVAFTADHGEALGEHGAWGHGLNLYREALHVPLLLRGPGVPPGEEERPVDLQTLAPTLLRLAGAGPIAGGARESLFSPRPGRPLVAATFSAGPLRWCVRWGDRKVVIRTNPQPDLGSAPHRTVLEGHPLPEGIFAFDLARDPAENRPGPIRRDELDSVATAFAASVGTLAPGLEMLVVPGEAPAQAVLAVDGSPRLQVFATAAASLTTDGPSWTLRLGSTTAPTMVVLELASRPARPVLVGAVPPRVGSGLPERPPQVQGPGTFLWWNESEPIVQHGQAETIQKLRNLGYLQ